MQWAVAVLYIVIAGFVITPRCYHSLMSWIIILHWKSERTWRPSSNSKLSWLLLRLSIFNLEQAPITRLSAMLALHPLSINLSVTPDGIDFTFSRVSRTVFLCITHSNTWCPAEHLYFSSTFTHLKRWWARLIASVNRRSDEVMRLCRSFSFVRIHYDGTDDSEVRLMQTYLRWNCLRRSPSRGSNVFASIASVTQRSGSLRWWDVCMQMINWWNRLLKEKVRTRSIQSARSLLLSLSLSSITCSNWELAPPLVLLNGVYATCLVRALHTLHYEIPKTSIHSPYNFHTTWYVSIQWEGTNVSMSNLAPFSNSQQLLLHCVYTNERNHLSTVHIPSYPVH